MKIRYQWAAILALLVFVGCGGGGGGSTPSRSTQVKFTVNWAARTRALSGPSSALSLIAVIKKAGANGADVTLAPVINRTATNLNAYAQDFTSTNTVPVGTWPLHAEFHAQADGAGDIVGTVDANVTINADGSGIGNIATVSTIASVQVDANQNVSVNSTKDLTFTVKDASNPPKLVAVTQGSGLFTVTGGTDKLQVTPSGSATGVTPGSATVTVSVDGIVSQAQTVTVNYPGGGVLQALSVADNNGATAPVVVETGAIPTNGTSSAPALDNSSTQVIRGGTMFLSITTAQPVDDLLIAVQGQLDYLQANVSGNKAVHVLKSSVTKQPIQHEVTYTALSAKYPTRTVTRKGVGGRSPGGTTYQALISLPTDLTVQNFTIQVATTTAGITSQIATQAVTVNTSAQTSNTLQVSLTWAAPVDLDLHVMTPDGTEIGYDYRTGQNGGTLDLDSNAACDLDNIDNENVTWAGQAPASGVYVVRPNLWSACDQTTPIPYTIRVNNYGITQTYQGVFQPGEANQNAGTDPAKLIYIAVLPPIGTDAGVLARTLIAESQSPGSTNSYDPTQVTLGMSEMKAAIDNRLHHNPAQFLAPGATTYFDIITAPGQFAGISKDANGNIVFAPSVQASIANAMFKPNLPVWSAASYQLYINNMLNVVNAPVTDKFANLTMIGNVAVTGGVYGWRTVGSSTTNLGNLVVIPDADGGTIAGNYFLALKSN